MIDNTILMQHLKADDHELQLASEYLAQAIVMCEGYCNRKFYDDQATADADFIVALADAQELRAWRDAQIDMEPGYDVCALVRDRYLRGRAAIQTRCNGMVVNKAIEGAILKQTGYLFRRRQEGAELTVEVGRILDPYVWPGDLAGVGRGS